MEMNLTFVSATKFFSTRLLIIIIISRREKWTVRFHERFVLLISQTRYNSPFLHRCIKTEFLFSLSLSLYSVLHVSNYNVRILQINLRSTHSTRLFSTFSLPLLSFFEIRLFLPWNCVLIQQIYLSIRRIENWNVDECDFDSRNDPDLFTDSRRPLLIEFQSRGALAPRPEKAFKPITILEFPAAARVSRGGIISWITEARDNNSPPAINWNLWS